MRYSWNEIKVRAAAFSREYASATYEKGETQSFYNDFFKVFGVKRRQVALFERQVTKLNNKQGFIDLFWPGVLLVEQKSAGRALTKAKAQAEEYCLGLKDYEMCIRDRNYLSYQDISPHGSDYQPHKSILSI